MNKYIFYILFISFSILISKFSFSQSAVYFCETTGKYGYAFGSSLEEVKQSAYNSCIKNGGVDPQLIVYTENKGYGAIALGNDANGFRVIGAAVGFSSASSASSAAIETCKKYGGKNIKVEVKWYDK